MTYNNYPWITAGLGTQEKLTGKHIFLDSVHSDQDEWYDWQVDDAGDPIYGEGLNSALQYAMYEVIVELEVDFDKEKVEVLAFNLDGVRYTPDVH